MTERNIFLALIDLPREERAAYLNGTCAGNPELRAKVEALLAAHEKSGSFLNAPGDPNRTLDTPDANRDFDSHTDISFLLPGTKPGSLGRLAHYEILEVLGRGGFGIVFKAFDEKLHRIVAIKAMAPHLAATSPPRKRFLREARAVAAIKHENVVAVFAVEEQPIPYLVMEFVAGETLQQHIDRTGPLDLPEIQRFAKQIALGLQAAHEIGLIHRDIKPGNILIEAGPEPKAKLTDFGLARAADDASLTQSGLICGTPMYMAPEQAEGKPVSPRSDLFSLGSVMYVMCSGRPPFRAESTLAVLRRVTEDTPRPIREIVESVPDWLCSIIERLHEKHPEDRYASAKNVVEALERAEAESSAATRLYSPPRKAKSQSRIWLAILGLFALAACTIGLFALVWLIGSRDVAKQNPNLPDVPDVIPATMPKPALPDGLATTVVNSIGMEFVKVPKGTGWLGGGDGKPGETKVVMEQDYYLGKYEVTQEEWEAVMGQNPSHFSRIGAGRNAVRNITDADLKRFPVEMVSWDDCQLFIKKLNEKVKETGWVYRLPKEAEWEYACRGGPVNKKESGFDFYFAKPTNAMKPEQANAGALTRRTCKVGSYEPNLLGLHDLHGNVHEWCDDAEGATSRVARGGNWWLGYGTCLATYRDLAATGYRTYGLGIRVARVPVKPQGEASSFINKLGMEFVKVPKGTGWLGGGDGKPGETKVVMEQDYYLGKYEVTQEEWEAVMGQNPSHFSRTGAGRNVVRSIPDSDLKGFPVESVSWDDCQRFIKKLNEKVKETGWVYRLPKEAEWEYACRGGPVDRVESGYDFYFAKPTNDLKPEQANAGALTRRTCKVGSYQPNLLGLHDLHGNVHEWCDDTLTRASEVSHRAIRGGHWNLVIRFCLATTRYTFPPTHQGPGLGLRVARVPVDQEKDKSNRKPAHIDGGDWRIDGDEMIQAKPGVAILEFGDTAWTDYDYAFEAKTEPGVEKAQGPIVYFRAKNAIDHMSFVIGAYGGEWYEVHRIFDSQWKRDIAPIRTPYEAGRWDAVNVRIRGAHVTCSFNGKVMFNYTDETIPSGRIGLATWNTSIRFRNLKVTSPEGKVLFEGFPDLPALEKPKPDR